MKNLSINSLYLAWADTKARYKKTVLGPIWPVLANLLAVLGLSLVWGEIMGQEMKVFVPQLSIGLVLWQLISGIITEAPGNFYRNAPAIKNIPIPLWFITIRMLTRHVINLLHNVIIVVGVIFYFDINITLHTIWVLPALILVIVNLFWLAHLLSILGTRFRDIEYLLIGIIPMVFFISPIVFRADRLPIGLNIIWLNPISYMIEAIRGPIISSSLHENTYIVLVMMLLGGSTLTAIVHKKWGPKLAYWV